MNVWKIGSRWDIYGAPNKSIIDIFLNYNIVFAGHNEYRKTDILEKIQESITVGDLIAVSNGVPVIAIGKINSKPKLLNEFESSDFVNENQFELFKKDLERYKIHFDDWSIGFNVKLYKLEKAEYFDYVRGTFNFVHNPYKNKIIEFYRKRMPIKSENNKIILSSLRLNNIKRFEDFKINFDKKITCIIAENGIGKTTIISSLALAICGVDANTIIKDNDYSSHKLIKDQFLRIENINSKEFEQSIEHSEEGSIQLNYKINKAYRNKINFSKEGLKGIIVKDEEEDDSFGINTEKNYFKTLIIGFPQGQVRHKEKDFGFADAIYPNISDVYSLITSDAEDKLSSFSKWLNQIYSEGKQNLKNKKITTIFKLISKIISKEDTNAIRLKTIKFNSKGDPVLIVKTLENPKGIQLELISQGLANVFTWVGHFVQRIYEAYPETENVAKINAILIIDEIDKYLHPKWQKRILKVLLEVFENTQFIITTHSPLVLDGLEKGQVARIKLDENDKPIVEYNETNIWGWGYQDILKKWMLKPTPYEYNLNEEELRLEKLIEKKAGKVEISILEDKILRIKESYEGKDPLSEFKKERLKREEELKNKNTALKEIITKLREENENLKIKHI